MKCNVFSKLAMCVASLLVGGSVMAGCAGNLASTVAADGQQPVRSYLSQVNEVMDQLDTSLDAFAEAVSQGDVVGIRAQADNAYRTLDRLSGLTAPDNLADIQQGYKDGTAKLREALDGYITLYTDVQSGSFDWSSYNGRVADIQAIYDEGVAALQKADETAAAQKG